MKHCEICGNVLVGEQQRFCCTRCRNVFAGHIKKKRYRVPERDELARLYLLPPDGQGMNLVEIGTIYGVSDVTAGTWLKEHGLMQDQKKRLRFYRIQNPKPRLPVPSKAELEQLYRMPPKGMGLTLEGIAEKYGVHRGTVSRWLKWNKIAEPHSTRHSKRMSGSANSSFKGGGSRGYHKRLLTKSEKPHVCEWCKSTEKLHVHHINHNIRDGRIENLTWLCFNCNLMESHLWALNQSGRAIVDIQPGQIIVQFTNK